jgi:CO dehydrogenase maturation factor
LIIAVSGKGGTGKTLLSAILVKLLSKTGKDVLIIDLTLTLIFLRFLGLM